MTELFFLNQSYIGGFVNKSTKFMFYGVIFALLFGIVIFANNYRLELKLHKLIMTCEAEAKKGIPITKRNSEVVNYFDKFDCDVESLKLRVNKDNISNATNTQLEILVLNYVPTNFKDYIFPLLMK